MSIQLINTDKPVYFKLLGFRHDFKTNWHNKNLKVVE